MKKKRNSLDEMQEHKLMKIEGAGFWLAFWGLLAAILIQVVIEPDLKGVAGELAVFFAMSVYLTAVCLKNGLWSRSPAPTLKGSAIAGAAAAAAVGAILTVRAQLILRSGLSAGFVVTLLLSMAIVFAGCFATMEIARGIYRRRRGRLDGMEEEEEEP